MYIYVYIYICIYIYMHIYIYINYYCFHVIDSDYPNNTITATLCILLGEYPWASTCRNSQPQFVVPTGYLRPLRAVS